MQIIKQPEFDETHDAQLIFRQLLDSMARPGNINSIAAVLEKMEQNTFLPVPLLAAALTLLDREVSFHLVGVQSSQAKTQLEWMTGSRSKGSDQADYVFVNDQPAPDQIDSLMSCLRIGTLLEPDHSATLIIRVEELSNEQTLPLALRLHGPGIASFTHLFIKGLEPEWLIRRAIINQEYPTGCDFILITDTGKIAAIPRTTQIESECF